MPRHHAWWKEFEFGSDRDKPGADVPRRGGGVVHKENDMRILYDVLEGGERSEKKQGKEDCAQGREVRAVLVPECDQ